MQSLMIENNPGFETLLREIHVTLHKNEDLVHMISEEESKDSEWTSRKKE